MTIQTTDPDRQFSRSHFCVISRRGGAQWAGLVALVVVLVGIGVAAVAILSALGSEGQAEGTGGSEGTDPSAAATLPSADGGSVRIAPPEKLEELLRSVQAYATNNDPDAAEAILRSALTEYPDDQDLRIALGELYLGQGRTEDALETYRAAMATGNVDHELDYRAALMCIELDRHEEAVDHLTAARDAAPNVPNYGLMLANELLVLNRAREAQATLLQVTTIAPDEPLAWGALSLAALRQGQATIAQQHAERAIELDPEQPAYRLYLARALQRQAQPEEAILELSGLPEEIQLQPEYLKTIGECFGLLGRPEEAAARYQKAYELREGTPGASVLAFETALWFDRAGENEQATSWAQRAQELGSDSAARWLAAVEADG